MVQIEENIAVSLRLAASIANAGNPIPFMQLWKTISESGDFELIRSLHGIFKHDLISVLSNNRHINFNELNTYDLSDPTLFVKVLDDIGNGKKN